jgi:hypothetical protein
MIYLALFACAVALGWRASFKWGGSAERETMCLLTCIWLATIAANLVTGSVAPVEFYGPLDLFGLIWLAAHQRRNWQWIPAGLFAVMLLTHVIFWSGTHSGQIVYAGRPYQDFLAFFAYLQVGSVAWASHERVRAARGRVSRMGLWALADNWLFVRRRHRGPYAETK